MTRLADGWRCHVHRVQEPFSILPLEVLCDAVKAQSLELLANDASVAALVSGYAQQAAPKAP